MASKKAKATSKKVTATQRKSTEGRRRSLANLKPWPKGVSGNPSGKKPARTLSEAYRAVLSQPLPNDPSKTYADKIAEVIAKEAITGNIIAAKEIADRTEGRPRQAIDISVEEKKRTLVNNAIEVLMNETGLDREEAIEQLSKIEPQVSSLIH